MEWERFIFKLLILQSLLKNFLNFLKYLFQSNVKSIRPNFTYIFPHFLVLTVKLECFFSMWIFLFIMKWPSLVAKMEKFVLAKKESSEWLQVGSWTSLIQYIGIICFNIVYQSKNNKRGQVCASCSGLVSYFIK